MIYNVKAVSCLLVPLITVVASFHTMSRSQGLKTALSLRVPGNRDVTLQSDQHLWFVVTCRVTALYNETLLMSSFDKTMVFLKSLHFTIILLFIQHIQVVLIQYLGTITISQS